MNLLVIFLFSCAVELEWDLLHRVDVGIDLIYVRFLGIKIRHVVTCAKVLAMFFITIFILYLM